MHFINPLDTLAIDNLSPEAIRLERKRLLSLTDLSADGMLDLSNGKYLSKSDIVKLCDSIEEEQNILFYGIIRKHPLLGSFLTDGQSRFFYQYHSLPEMQIPGFLAFVYPYFLQQFQQKIVELYEQSSANYMKANEEFGVMCDFRLPFSNIENKACFKLLHSRLSRSADDIDYASQNRRGSGSALLDRILKAVKPDILNRLSADFDPEKARIGDRLYRLCIDLYQRKILYATNLDILRLAQKVNWPGQLNESFRKLHMAQQVLNGAIESLGRSQDEGLNFWQTLKYTVIVLVVVFSISTYFRKSNSNHSASGSSGLSGSFGKSGNSGYQQGAEYYTPPDSYEGDTKEHPLTKLPYDHTKNPFVGLSKEKALEFYNKRLLDIALKGGKTGKRQKGELLSTHDLVKFYYLRAKLGAKATITTTDMQQSIEYWQAQGSPE